MLKRLRERAGSESGFTLIELLVVMLILGILAAIAIPAFLNQKNKATDSSAKVNARILETAMETCSTDNDGQYNAAGSPCNLAALRANEPQVPASGVTADPTTPAGGYTVSAVSATGNTFTITKSGNGQ